MKADYVVIYDGECRACRGFAKVVGLMDVGRRTWLVPAQSERAQGLVPHKGTDELLEALHVVDRGGQVLRGGDAMLQVLSVLPVIRAFSLALASLPRGRRWANRAYGWLSRHRRWISRLA